MRLAVWAEWGVEVTASRGGLGWDRLRAEERVGLYEAVLLTLHLWLLIASMHEKS